MFSVGMRVLKKIQGSKDGSHLELFQQPEFRVTNVTSEIVTITNQETNESYEYDHNGFKLNPIFWDHEVRNGTNLIVKTFIISRIFEVD